MKLPEKKLTDQPKRNLPTRPPDPELSDIEILESRADGKMSVERGLSLFNRFIERTFPEELVVGLLKDLTNASVTKKFMDGKEVQEPHWPARAEGLRILLKLKRLFPEFEFDDPRRQKAKAITLHVVPTPPRKT